MSALQRDFLGRGLDDLSRDASFITATCRRSSRRATSCLTWRECVIVGERGTLVADYGSLERHAPPGRAPTARRYVGCRGDRQGGAADGATSASASSFAGVPRGVRRPRGESRFRRPAGVRALAVVEAPGGRRDRHERRSFSSAGARVQRGPTWITRISNRAKPMHGGREGRAERRPGSREQVELGGQRSERHHGARRGARHQRRQPGHEHRPDSRRGGRVGRSVGRASRRAGQPGGRRPLDGGRGVHLHARAQVELLERLLTEEREAIARNPDRQAAITARCSCLRNGLRPWKAAEAICRQATRDPEQALGIYSRAVLG